MVLVFYGGLGEVIVARWAKGNKGRRNDRFLCPPSWKESRGNRGTTAAAVSGSCSSYFLLGPRGGLGKPTSPPHPPKTLVFAKPIHHRPGPQGTASRTTRLWFVAVCPRGDESRHVYMV